MNEELESLLANIGLGEPFTVHRAYRDVFNILLQAIGSDNINIMHEEITADTPSEECIEISDGDGVDWPDNYYGLFASDSSSVSYCEIHDDNASKKIKGLTYYFSIDANAVITAKRLECESSIDYEQRAVNVNGTINTFTYTSSGEKTDIISDTIKANTSLDRSDPHDSMFYLDLAIYGIKILRAGDMINN